tara:strand:+ start:383 stop:697 length:315 start_codon:yes stop_codon:yes gene_type:complete
MVKKIKINPSQEIEETTETTDSNDNDRDAKEVYNNQEQNLEPECDLETKEVKLITEKRRGNISMPPDFKFIAEITQNFIFKTELDRDTWLSYYFASFHSGGTKG